MKNYDNNPIMVDLKTVLALLRINLPTIYDYCMRTGTLSETLGKLFGCDSDTFIASCYWANVSMISTSLINYEERKPDQGYIDYYRKHVTRGSDFFEEKGQNEIANIIKYHHERPDGKGYLRAMSYPLESNFIRIADEFIALTRQSHSRGGQAYDTKEAARMVMAVPYRNITEIGQEGAEAISNLLSGWKG